MRYALLLCMALLPGTLFADGKVFPSIAIREPVTIPDQRALIHWADGTERLVIQTSFSGTGTNFAWVVPLPSKPVIEKAPSGLFPTLDYLFEPELVDKVAPWYVAVVFGLGLLGLVLAVKPGKRLTMKGTLMLIAVVVAAFLTGPSVGVFVLVLLPLGVFMVCANREPVYSLLLLTLIGLMLSALLLPSLGRTKAAGISEESRTLEILERNRVGAYDTVTLSAKDPAELERWLGDNGFAMSSNAMPVIADYTRRQWVFVAAKLARTNSAPQTESIHPLAFTFKSTKAVYPMRLTGVDGGPLSVDLYLFGPGTASAAGFTLQHSSRPEYPDPPKDWVRKKPKTLQIHYPVLRDWVKGTPVATRLRGNLSKAQQDRDITIRWTRFWPKTSREFSQRGAFVYSANIASAVLVGGVLAIGMLRLRTVRVPAKMSLALAAAVAGTAVIGYALLDKVPVRYAKVYHTSPISNLRMLGMLSTLANTMEGVREEIDFALKHGSANKIYPNTWLGGIIHEEESPGNYVLRDTGKAIEFVVYDAAAAPHVTESTPKDEGTNGAVSALLPSR